MRNRAGPLEPQLIVAFEARADGWKMVKTSTKALLQQSSFAHLPKEAFAHATSINKQFHLKDSILFGTKPAS